MDYRAVGKSFECEGLTDAEFLEQVVPHLVEKYKDEDAPKCPLCGLEMHWGGIEPGRITYHCDTALTAAKALPAEDPTRQAKYDEAWKHYRQSTRTVHVTGDSRVLDLIKRFRRRVP